MEPDDPEVGIDGGEVAGVQFRLPEADLRSHA
jgi:hypothetical protein